MTYRDIFKAGGAILCNYPFRLAVVLLIILSATFYPSDFETDYAQSKNGLDSTFVQGIEEYGRHANTVVPLGIAIVTRDIVGLKQMLVVTLVGIVATHGPKRWLNNVEIAGTRLGQRPYSPTSNHNMPSGHSALAASGAMIMFRRYSKILGVLGVIVTLLTMYARYMLDKHTISATIAGALIGGIIAVLFMTKRRR